METIGIDNGYGYTKTVSHTFISGLVYKGEDQPASQNVIKYNGNYYEVDTKPKQQNGNKTKDDDVYILSLIAIAKELQSRGGKTTEDVTLGVGLPLSRTRGSVKDSFKKYFEREPEVDFEYDGVPYHISIKGAYVFPQCIAGIFNLLNNKKIKAPSIVVDIGSWTTEILRIDKDRERNNAPVPTSDYTTIDYGIIHCLDKCNDEIYSLEGKYLAMSQLQEIIQGNYGIVPQKYVDIVVPVITRYFDSLVKELNKKGYDTETTPITLMGGGAKILKRFYGTKDFYDVSIIENINANAIGFEQLAKNMGDKR